MAVSLASAFPTVSKYVEMSSGPALGPFSTNYWRQDGSMSWWWWAKLTCWLSKVFINLTQVLGNGLKLAYTVNAFWVNNNVINHNVLECYCSSGCKKILPWAWQLWGWFHLCLNSLFSTYVHSYQKDLPCCFQMILEKWSSSGKTLIFVLFSQDFCCLI